MVLTREKKKEILKKLKEKIEKQKIMIFVDFKGMKTKEIFALKSKLKEKESEMKVIKKTLANLVFKEKLNINLKKFLGQLGIVFGYSDEIVPAKIVFEFSEKNPNLKILGAFLNGNLIEKEKVEELAKLPSREELQSKLLWSLKFPISGFYNVLRGNLENLIFVLTQIQQKVKS